MKKIIQQYAKDLTAGRLASGYEHSYRIYHLAREIGEGKDYDDEVLHAACFLHDLELMVDHPRGSSRKAESILGETGFPAEKIPLVTRSILQHLPGDVPESVEGKLLHDANLLDSIGAVGFARLSIGAFFWRHHKTLEDVVKMLEEELSHADRFFFAESREMAKAKKGFMGTAIEQLKKELEL
ncbi:MAG TPA: HD domain-containing protein [Spirochaetia bacterium]|nr:HD domain-containing protein [Spirochaetia bacterium]